jgi:hypothetical protein
MRIVSFFMIFPDRLFRGFDHRVHAVPFVFGIVQMKLLGAVRAFKGELGWRSGRNFGAFKGDHDKAKYHIRFLFAIVISVL